MAMHSHDEINGSAVAKLRLAYQRPRLTLLGDVANMTESGSMATMEDLVQNNSCRFDIFNNMTGNMC